MQQLLDLTYESSTQSETYFPADYSLASGSAGLALVLQCALETLPGDPSWEGIIHKLIRDTANAATAGVAGIELFKGLAGLGFAATAASQNGRRYQTLLTNLNSSLSSQTMSLASRVCSACGLPTADFDVISGLSGVIAYLLYSKQRNEDTLSVALNALVSLAGTVDAVPRCARSRPTRSRAPAEPILSADHSSFNLSSPQISPQRSWIHSQNTRSLAERQ